MDDFFSAVVLEDVVDSSFVDAGLAGCIESLAVHVPDAFELVHVCAGFLDSSVLGAV